MTARRERHEGKMAMRVFCDCCDTLISEHVDNKPTKGTGILLGVRVCEGIDGPRVDLCPSCARKFLPLLPKHARETFERAIIRHEHASA